MQRGDFRHRVLFETEAPRKAYDCHASLCSNRGTGCQGGRAAGGRSARSAPHSLAPIVRPAFACADALMRSGFLPVCDRGSSRFFLRPSGANFWVCNAVADQIEVIKLTRDPSLRFVMPTRWADDKRRAQSCRAQRSTSSVRNYALLLSPRRLSDINRLALHRVRQWRMS